MTDPNAILRRVIAALEDFIDLPELATPDALADLEQRLDPLWSEEDANSANIAVGFIRLAMTNDLVARQDLLIEAKDQVWLEIYDRGLATEAEQMDDLVMLDDFDRELGLPLTDEPFPKPL